MNFPLIYAKWILKQLTIIEDIKYANVIKSWNNIYGILGSTFRKVGQNVCSHMALFCPNFKNIDHPLWNMDIL